MVFHRLTCDGMSPRVACHANDSADERGFAGARSTNPKNVARHDVERVTSVHARFRAERLHHMKTESTERPSSVLPSCAFPYLRSVFCGC